MTQGERQAMARESKTIWRWGAIAVAVSLLVYVAWSYASNWVPSRKDYAIQGVVVSGVNGNPQWSMLAATGVDFAYLTATEGAGRRDKSFASNLEGVKQVGIRYGALHHFDICRLATDQATLFITTVPRSENALPPAVQLDFSNSCTGRPNRELILSELVTFLAQIEAHSGVPAVLLVSKEFDKEYGISKSVDRNIWVEGDWFPPDYTARPWVMWTANTSRQFGGIEGPVRWVVVRN